MHVLVFWFQFPGATHATHWLLALKYGVFGGQTHYLLVLAMNPGGHAKQVWEDSTYHEFGGHVEHILAVAFQKFGVEQETQRLFALSNGAVGGQMHLNSVG